MVLEWTAHDAAAALRKPTAADDKYSRGVLGVRTGSERYPGAAVLGVEAAQRTGVGMVRYLGPSRAASLVLARRPEIVAVDGRVQAWLIGSGTDAADRSPAETAVLRSLIDAKRAEGGVPVVVDAGALDLVASRSGDVPLVVTPHDREHERLRHAAGLTSCEGRDREEAAADTAAALGITVVLKGSRTLVVTPSGWTRQVTAPTSWLATAGTGDVLAGILGALVSTPVAGGVALDEEVLGARAATAAYLHGQAGAAASAARGGGPITALDVAEGVATTVGALLAGHDHALL